MSEQKVKLVTPEEFNSLVAKGEKVVLMVKNENCFVCKTFEPSLVASDKADKRIEVYRKQQSLF